MKYKKTENETERKRKREAEQLLAGVLGGAGFLGDRQLSEESQIKQGQISTFASLARVVN